MKKIIAILLAVAVAVSMAVMFSSCGEKEEKTLVMACHAEFPPYEYYEGDKIIGIDAEVAQEIADKLGMKLKIEDVEFASIIPGVQTGKYDLGMSGITKNEERLKTVDFSDSYATGIQVVIIKENGIIKTLDDIKDKRIGVQTSTTGDIYATGDFGEDHITRYDNGAVATQALVADKIDCIILDNEPAKKYVEANKGLTILKSAYIEEEYAIAIAKGNTELKNNVNNALKELIADGSLKRIIDKYIKAD